MPRDDRVGYRHFLRSRAVFVERPEGLAGRRRCNNTVNRPPDQGVSKFVKVDRRLTSVCSWALPMVGGGPLVDKDSHKGASHEPQA
jgi:hypothetical protein